MINCRHSRIRVLTSPKRRTFSGQALRFHYNLVPAERPAAVATFGILGYRLTGGSSDAPPDHLLLVADAKKRERRDELCIFTLHCMYLQ